MNRTNSILNAAIESSTVAKGSAGGVGAFAAWLSKHAHDLDPFVQAFTLYGGALVVALTMGCWALDMRRKWKHRND